MSAGLSKSLSKMNYSSLLYDFVMECFTIAVCVKSGLCGLIAMDNALSEREKETEN